MKETIFRGPLSEEQDPRVVEEGTHRSTGRTRPDRPSQRVGSRGPPHRQVPWESGGEPLRVRGVGNKTRVQVRLVRRESKVNSRRQKETKKRIKLDLSCVSSIEGTPVTTNRTDSTVR